MATIGEWAKVYGTGNYADTSKRIGTAVEDAIGQNRARTDRMRDEEDRQRRISMEDYAMEQMKMREYSGLIVPRMSDYDSIETHFQDAANFLPDAYARIENDKSLSSSERARGKAQVLAEVGALKASKAKITSMVLNYEQGLNNDQISGYNPMSALDFANTLITPNNGLRIEGRDNGNFLVGKTIGGEKVDVSLKDTDRIPGVVYKTADPRVMLQSLNTAAYDRNIYDGSNDELVRSYRDSFTQTMNGIGANTMDPAYKNNAKGFAVDWLNFTPAQVDEYYDNTGEGTEGFKPPEKDRILGKESYRNQLEYEMEKRYIQKGQALFVNDELGRLKNEELRLANQAKKINNRDLVNNGINPSTVNKTSDLQDIYNVLMETDNTAKNDAYNALSLDVGPSFEATILNPSVVNALGALGFVVDNNTPKTGGSGDNFGTIPEKIEGINLKKGNGPSIFIPYSMTKPEQIFEAIGIGMGLDRNAIKNQFKEFTKNYTSNTSTYSGYVLDPPQNP